MPLGPGARLGPYEILGALGAGGMGEVYRARDPRLDRDVAIKVLSGGLAADPAALARFEREALSVAKLSHPNVLSIFELGTDGGTAFVVTELLDGRTLRSRLEEGPLPARRAVGYALQIAKGMAAAHGRGIVHRDLKPDNVMIGRDDQVKILDFGLAKPVETKETDETRGVATSAGAVLGTHGYMAPEQVRAQALDHRADIFAFGAVLYEMLCGERAFRGATAADTMTAILTKEPPDFDAARLSIAPGLERIVRRCLEKSPELRFQSANDLAFALETLSGASTSTPSAAVQAAAPPRRKAGVAWLPWTIAAAALLVAAAAWLAKGKPPVPESPWARFTRISESSGEETSPSLSPDGGTVVYAARGKNGGWGIWSQRVGGRNATVILDDPNRDECAPAFAPDGTRIAFHESDETGGIFVAGATGESVRRVTDGGFDPAWSPDGTRVAFATEEIANPASRVGLSELYVVDAEGGTPKKIAEQDAVQPSWSPSGRFLVFWSNTNGQRDLFVVRAEGGQREALTQDPAIDWSPAWSPDGRFVYFSSDRGGAMNLWRIGVDPGSGKALGQPEPVTLGVQASAALPRFSKDGARMAFRSRVSSVNPVAIPIDPVTLRAGAPVVLDTQNNIRVPSGVSPDGKLIAYFAIGDQQEDIFVGPPEGPMRRVTDDAARDRVPSFTPDGRALVFYSTRGGTWEPWIIGIDGGGLRKITNMPSGAVFAWPSPKGDIVVFCDDSGRNMYAAPLAAGATTTPTKLGGTAVGDLYFNPTGWSPDGARLAGFLGSNYGGSSGVGIYDLTAGQTTKVSDDDATGVKFLADGRRIVYFTKEGSELVVLDSVTGARHVVDVRLPAPSISEVFAIAPDGRTLYYGAARAEADIWISERE